MEQNITTNTFALQVDNSNIPYLAEAAKWAKFLAILGFIFCAIIVIAGFFAGTIASTIFPQLQQEGVNQMGITNLIGDALIALLYFFPCLYLFNFATKMQSAIRNNDQVYLNVSLKNLKSWFKFCGILAVLFLCIAVIGIIFAIVGLSFLHH